jgi:pimeloyl-ACP methyl ester carboxylesterase
MGGAAVWLAAAREPELFDAVAAEDSFAVLDEAVDRWFAMLFPGGKYVFAPVRWFANGMAGIDPSTVRPVDAAQKWRGRPALVIHCSNDLLMDGNHSNRLARAAGCEVWTIDGASHAQGYGDAGSEYLAKLVELAGAARGRGRELSASGYRSENRSQRENP